LRRLVAFAMLHFLIFKFIIVPITANFSATQSYATPSSITFTNSSTGTDITAVALRISLLTAQGTYLVPSGNSSTQYITWPLADATLTTDVLGGTDGKDYGLLCLMEYLNVSGTVVASKSQVLGFTIYNENFDFTLSQMLSGNSPLMNDNRFFEKKSLLRTYIDSGNKAIELASDYLTAQICYDEATSVRNAAQYLFNINI